MEIYCCEYPKYSSIRGQKKMTIIQRFVIIISLAVFFQAHTHATQFVYNGFHGGGGLKLSGSADILSSGLLQLTDFKTRVLGHAFHPSPLHFKNHTFSFSTTFVFSIDPEHPDLGGHGMALVITPFPDLPGAFPGQFLGLLNSSTMGTAFNHLFAVEFDAVRDFELEDIDDNHVGIDLNTLVSVASAQPEVCFKCGENILAWIDVNDAGSNHKVDVFVAIAGSGKPSRPLLSAAIDLSAVILKGDVYVGFSAGTGLLSSKHRVMGWSFNTNGSAADLVLPPGKRGRQLVIIVPSVALAALFCGLVSVLVLRRRRLRNSEVEEWELELAPRRFTYSELEVATKGFKELLGSGGFGRVYRGVLSGGQEVAVKRVAHDSKQGLREFAAEISTIGRLRHRNLVKLHGYCRRQRKAELLLVYDYMPNGSLDRHLFFTGGGPGLSWERRLDILKGVAAALLYIHEEWERRVVHRDVKASNVLLDGKFNARLEDFGLARLYDHGKNPQTTKAVGTLGYVAPEQIRTGKATPSSDVFSYGALLLEVACGRRPVEPRRCDEEMVLVEWVWGLQVRGEVLLASDPRLFRGGRDIGEEVEVVLKLGLLCSHVVPERRPSMRQVVQILNRDAPLAQLPPRMPVVDHPPTPMIQGFKRNVSG